MVAAGAGALGAGSEAAFITEHYWGYTRQREGGTIEYRVEHPSWQIWDRAEAASPAPPAISTAPTSRPWWPARRARLSSPSGPRWR
jgi:hypothetical protein